MLTDGGCTSTAAVKLIQHHLISASKDSVEGYLQASADTIVALVKVNLFSLNPEYLGKRFGVTDTVEDDERLYLGRLALAGRTRRGGHGRMLGGERQRFAALTGCRIVTNNAGTVAALSAMLTLAAIARNAGLR
jgi:hypothetical protein